MTFSYSCTIDIGLFWLTTIIIVVLLIGRYWYTVVTIDLTIDLIAIDANTAQAYT